MKPRHISIAKINTITEMKHRYDCRLCVYNFVGDFVIPALQFTTGHSSSLASWSIAITSGSYLSNSLIENNPNCVAVSIHIDKLLCWSWWQPVLSAMETNAALLISNRYVDLSNQFRDLQWRSNHRAIPCHAWVVRNVNGAWLQPCTCWDAHSTSASFFAEISVSSPRKLFIFII